MLALPMIRRLVAWQQRRKLRRQYRRLHKTYLEFSDLRARCEFIGGDMDGLRKRPQFNLMMKHVEPGDTIIAYAYSRISRSLKFLLTFVDDMQALGVKLKSTTEPHIDPYSTNGRMVLSVTGAVDENERGRARDRTLDGMRAAEDRGMYLGRRPKFDDKQSAAIKRDRKTMNREAAAKKWKCSPGTIDKYAS